MYIYVGRLTQVHVHTRSRGGGSRGSDEPQPPIKKKRTIKLDVFLKINT